MRSLKDLTRPDIILLIGVGTAIALFMSIHLAYQPSSLWADELASVMFADQPLEKLWSSWIRRETNPPLYYTLLKWWSTVFGGSDRTIRFLSFVIGGSSIAFGALSVYSISKNAAASVAAAIWMACLPAHIEYSQEIRAYALAHLGVILTLYCFVKMVSRDGRGSTPINLWSLGYTISVSLAVYSHSTMLVVPALCTLAFCYLFKIGVVDRREAMTFFAASLGAAALCSWWLSITAWQVAHATNIDWIAKPTPVDALSMTLHVFVTGGLRLGLAPVALISCLALALIVLGILKYKRSPSAIYWMVALGLPAVLFIVSQFKPVMIPRTVYPASGAFIICMALGLSRVSSHILKALSFTALTALLIASLSSRVGSTKEPWREGVHLIAAKHPHALVIAGNHTAALAVMRYCVRPRCDLKLITLRHQDEASTKGMDLPNSRRGFQLSAHYKRPVFLLHRKISKRAMLPALLFPWRRPPMPFGEPALAGSRVRVFYSEPQS